MFSIMLIIFSAIAELLDNAIDEVINKRTQFQTSNG
jgi:hypothetical protein